MPRGQKKRKAGEGKAAASKKILTEQAAEAMESVCRDQSGYNNSHY